MSIFQELKRRQVFRVGVAYLALAWLLVEVTDTLFPAFGIPDWAFRLVVILLVLGFVPVLIFSWAYELTPEGLKRETDLVRDEADQKRTARRLDLLTIGVVVVALAFIAVDRIWLDAHPAASDTPAIAESDLTADSPATSDPPAKSVAVLPFNDMTRTGDQEWFADGLAEEILNTLARTPDLWVSSRTSSFAYKGSELDIPNIAAELGVAHLLEGSVRSSGNRIRVTAQLIRAADGFHVWSQKYDREEADMIEIQEDLAYRIAEALETAMDPAALQGMTRTGTRSVEAYKALLRGNALRAQGLSEGNPQLLLQSLAQFDIAREADPRFALAHRNAAGFWKEQMQLNARWNALTDASPAVIRQKYIEAIDQAILHAPNAVDRGGYQAAKALIQTRWQDGLRLYRTYLQERPNDHLALIEFADLALKAWNPEDLNTALTMLHQGSARSVDLARSYIDLAYKIGDPSEAADFGLEQLQARPNNEGLLYHTHRALMWAGRAEEGGELARRFRGLYGDNLYILARQACIEGRTAEVEALTEGLYWRFGRWYLLKLLGRDAEAVHWVQDLLTNTSLFAVAEFLTYPIFDPSDFPELVAILEREGVDRPPPVDIPFKCPPS